MGIVSNHVHVLVQCRQVIDLPKLVQTFKGASARVANRDGIAKQKLRWADGYDARSISPRTLSHAIAYVRGQARHHPLDAVHE
jgi:REP element-mobilizing transposase RayT